MAFVPAPNCASVEMIYTINGTRCENVFHVRGTTPFDETKCRLIAERFKGWWLTTRKPDSLSALVLNLIVVKALDTKYAPGIEYSTDLPSAGDVTVAEPAPNNVTVAVKWSTGLRGRSYRGRTYHLGLSNGQCDGNLLDSLARLELKNHYQALLDLFDDGDYEMVVLSKFEDNVERATAVATPITDVSIDPYLDSQRRRLTGRGS